MADGADVDEQPAAAADATHPRAPDTRDARAPMARVDTELRQDAARALRQSIECMEEFLRRPERTRPGAGDPTHLLCSTLCREAHTFLIEALAERPRPMPSEHTLRCAYRLAGALRVLIASNAPPAQESGSIARAAPASRQDAVAYARYGSADIVAQEAAYARMLGIDARRARLLLTSSGMAAYALIETFLLREVLKSGDRIVTSPGIYFETRHQLQSLPFFDLAVARGGAREDMLDAIVEHRPRVVFVDPLTNSVELRLIDLPRLLDAAESVCGRETWFVVDGTLLSGSFDPFARERRGVRVLYYESGCKYLQLGADLGPTGIVMVERGLAARFEHWRRGIGAVASDTLVLPRVSRRAYLDFLRQQTACARAVAESVRDSTGEGAPIIACSFPSEADHPDFADGQRYEHLGGVLAFRFLDARLNCRRPLELFIDRLMTAARGRGVALTAGVSFGYRVPRVGAAWIGYADDEAFLRLSAGVCRETAARLGRLVVECARRFDWPAGSAE